MLIVVMYCYLVLLIVDCIIVFDGGCVVCDGLKDEVLVVLCGVGMLELVVVLCVLVGELSLLLV